MPSNPYSFFTSLFLFLSVNAFFFACCYCVDHQGRALLSWKSTLKSNSDALETWNSADPTPCNWFGIGCNGDGEVINVTLRSVALQGRLPSSFRSLKSLKTLVISSTNISGPIPKEFGDYQGLVYLDLTENQISGDIPEEICELRNLESLYLNSNSIRGAIPSDIGKLSSLITLTLYDNDLRSVIPASIGELKKLEVFRAGGNRNLKGSLPAEIGNCSNLVMLGFAETGISGHLPSSIGLLKRIRTIAIYGALLSGGIPEEIGNCSDLVNVYLYDNSLSGPIPPQLGSLRKLRNLLLWQNSLLGAIPPELGSCAELIVLDLSVNLLSGGIPGNLGQLSNLQELHLGTNQLSGSIPPEISNCTALRDIELDNNQLSGKIQIDFKKMEGLTLFYAWRNNFTGSFPANLAQCRDLQSVDLSYNQFTGSIPASLFGLRNLSKLLLLSNELSGSIPPDIGNCTSLFRLRLDGNRLSGTIPAEIGNLKSLNFVDMSSNKLTGPIPPAISGCDNLEFLDLHSNSLAGHLPDVMPKLLQFSDLSDNLLTGPLPPSIGKMSELTKLVLRKNKLSGNIPGELGSCLKLQLLDLGDNAFTGDIPPELGRLPALEISLNLSCNKVSGQIPILFSSLRKLGSLDISHNQLIGSLNALAGLENLVTLNISFNSFSGELPNTPFFKKLPVSNFAGNDGLYIVEGDGRSHLGPPKGRTTMSSMKLAMTILISTSSVLLLLATYMLLRARASSHRDSDVQVWETTFYQKLDFSIDDILRCLTSSNVIGTGSSGIVYKVTLPSDDVVAVKKMWSPDDAAFGNEISVLGTIRHRNIVRLLGWGASPTTKLLFYGYLPNGSLRTFLGNAKLATDWDRRYGIALGLAHAVAYLHHDCLPPIIHGDVKAMNVLLGPLFEPYLADFGLARPMRNRGGNGKELVCKLEARTSPAHIIAGSYGYMAPEHASLQRMTEKSDVYSYGVVLLEIVTGRHPLDPALPAGAQHLVQWVLDHVHSKKEISLLLDSRLRGRPESEIQEMMQALAIGVLCLGARPSERPAMKDVVALLKEIRRQPEDVPKKSVTADVENSASPSPQATAVAYRGCSTCSFPLSESSS